MAALLKSKKFQGLLGFGISAAVIVWLYFSIDWKDVASKLQGINYWWLVPAFILLVIQFIARAVRWRFLLPEPVTNVVPIRQLFDSIMVGNLATNVLPLRAGEFVRPFLLTRMTRHGFSTCFVSVVIERFFDLSMVLFSFGGMLLFVKDIPKWAHDGAVMLSCVAISILIFIVVGSLMPERLMKVVDFFLAYAPKKFSASLRKFLQELLAGAAVLSNVANLLRVILLTLFVWFTTFATFGVYLLLFSLPPSPALAVSVTVIVALAVAAPSAPGFVGIFQVGCIAAFALFGLGEEMAMAYSIPAHLFQYVLTIIYGMYVLFRSNLSLRELQGSSSIDAGEAPIAADQPGR